MANAITTCTSYWAAKAAGRFLRDTAKPYTVETTRDGEYCVVSVNAPLYRLYTKRIRMKDKWWWLLLCPGRSWEGDVRKAQLEAFEIAHRKEKNEQIDDYRVARLK